MSSHPHQFCHSLLARLIIFTLSVDAATMSGNSTPTAIDVTSYSTSATIDVTSDDLSGSKLHVTKQLTS